MEIGNTVIPNEENDEEDLTRCNPSFLPLPAIRLGKGWWLSRWTLNDAEKRYVAETGDVYITLQATDGDELISPHNLFVGRPDIEKLKEYYGGEYKPSQGNESQTLTSENPKLSIDNKDELRLLIQEEISKAFDKAFGAALNHSVAISDSYSTEKREERQEQNAIVREIGNTIKNALRDLKDESLAKIVEKTDPARAERIRNSKPTF